MTIAETVFKACCASGNLLVGTTDTSKGSVSMQGSQERVHDERRDLA